MIYQKADPEEVYTHRHSDTYEARLVVDTVAMPPGSRAQ